MAGGVRKSQHTQHASGRMVGDVIRQRRQTWTSRARRSDGRNRRSRDEPSSVTNLKKSHHSNTSVIYLVQNLFPKNKESRTISLNSQCMVIFKNPGDASQIANLARQMYPGRGAFVQEAFTDATASPYGYLLIDLKQNTPDDLRLRTSILPDDAHQFVYVPKMCRKA